MSEALVAVEHLSHSFGEGELRRQVLFDVSARIGAGEIVILTGPSGSGKTTLLTLIGALRSAQEGSLRVLDRELRGASEAALVEVRQRIGYVFQAHNLLDSLTAQQNVELSLELDLALGPAERGERARSALEAVGLGDRLASHPGALSGGQRQRVAIARALARRPAILLADEPTASLDRRTGRTIVELIERLARREGVSVILVTHDNRILDVADRILTLEDGRLSSLMSVVASDTRNLLQLLARDVRRGELVERVRALDAAALGELLEQVTEETRRLLELSELVQGDAFESVLEQVLGALSLRVTDVVPADRATTFLVDEDAGEIWSPGSQHGRTAELRAPLGRGVAGLAARTGRAVRVLEAGREPSFDPSVDEAPAGAALMALPVADSHGRVFAVVELARDDGRGFEVSDETRLHELTESLGLVLEAWWRMSCACRAAGAQSCPHCGQPRHSHAVAPHA
jgi:putative ABC transport system ATP-binding protein